MDDLKDLFHLVAGFTQNEGSGDVRGISLNLATAIDENDRALTDNLRRNRPVREGRELTHLHIGPSFEAELTMGSFDQIFHILLGHSRF